MKTHPAEDGWDDHLQDEFRATPSKAKSASARLKETFAAVTIDIDKPEVTSRSKQNANLKWLLDKGFTEEQIVASFQAFAKKGTTSDLTASRWDAYFRRHHEFLTKAAGLGKDVKERRAKQDEMAAEASARSEREAAEARRQWNLDRAKRGGTVAPPTTTTEEPA